MNEIMFDFHIVKWNEIWLTLVIQGMSSRVVSICVGQTTTDGVSKIDKVIEEPVERTGNRAQLS